MKNLILTLSIIFLSSCAAKTIPVPVALQCPVPLVLPRLSENLISHFQMMPPELKTYFYTRDKLQTARRETLQSICRSTHIQD